LRSAPAATATPPKRTRSLDSLQADGPRARHLAGVARPIAIQQVLLYNPNVRTRNLRNCTPHCYSTVQSNLEWHSDNCCQEKDKIQESFAKAGKTVQVKLDKAHAVFPFVFLKQKRFTTIFVCTHCHCLHYLLD
jgi:hypothetical protein